MFTSYSISNSKDYAKAFGNPFEEQQKQGAKDLMLKSVASFIIAFVASYQRAWNKARKDAGISRVTKGETIRAMYSPDARDAFFPPLQDGTGAVTLFNKMLPYARTTVMYDDIAFEQYIISVVEQLEQKAPEHIHVSDLFETIDVTELEVTASAESASAETN